ncbi:hypothetical protein OIDMADRAFT_28625 [Oidiodendron maius Zn]|uniref:Uncharacterized protein n=1 Tax=Oidiodendron maius (strain Zn) TaxID=913774 RepID=A0A0C3GXW3_OIDMZ|nr:hypothetical protein OIDMADRAFT_28625 [Oidiodendron maius Zn]
MKVSQAPVLSIYALSTQSTGSWGTRDSSPARFQGWAASADHVHSPRQPGRSGSRSRQKGQRTAGNAAQGQIATWDSRRCAYLRLDGRVQRTTHREGTIRFYPVPVETVVGTRLPVAQRGTVLSHTIQAPATARLVARGVRGLGGSSDEPSSVVGA